MIMRASDEHWLPDGTVLRNEPLSSHTTFGIGGPADWFVRAETVRDVSAALVFAREQGVPLFILGGGSNVLFSDAGYRGVVLTLAGELARIDFDGVRVTAGAGALLPRVGLLAGKRGLSGLEFASGIPGQVGGAVVINAGTRDAWIGPLIDRIRLCNRDGEAYQMARDEAGFRYRGSDLGGEIVLGVELVLSEARPEEVRVKSQSYRRARTETQPVGTRNAGCVFKNPQPLSAGKLIDELGLKGFRVGDAMISPVHANFVINLGQATAEDVRRVMAEMKRRVRESYGVELEPEVVLVGVDAP